jgi:anti-anti-sigma factor
MEIDQTMEITTNFINNELAIIRLEGRFNIEEIVHFESEIKGIINNKVKSIAINLSSLKYIDSSGIGSLIKSANLSKNENVGLYLVDMSPEILNIFKLAYLDKFFTIIKTSELNSRFNLK